MNLRAGTENVLLSVGLGKACEIGKRYPSVAQLIAVAGHISLMLCFWMVAEISASDPQNSLGFGICLKPS